jgi:hypothetical protein
MGLKLFQLDNNKLESVPDEIGYLKVIYKSQTLRRSIFPMLSRLLKYALG